MRKLKEPSAPELTHRPKGQDLMPPDNGPREAMTMRDPIHQQLEKKDELLIKYRIEADEYQRLQESLKNSEMAADPIEP